MKRSLLVLVVAFGFVPMMFHSWSLQAQSVRSDHKDALQDLPSLDKYSYLPPPSASVAFTTTPVRTYDVVLRPSNPLPWFDIFDTLVGLAGSFSGATSAANVPTPVSQAADLSSSFMQGSIRVVLTEDRHLALFKYHQVEKAAYSIWDPRNWTYMSQGDAACALQAQIAYWNALNVPTPQSYTQLFSGVTGKPWDPGLALMQNSAFRAYSYRYVVNPTLAAVSTTSTVPATSPVADARTAIPTAPPKIVATAIPGRAGVPPTAPEKLYGGFSVPNYWVSHHDNYTKVGTMVEQAAIGPARPRPQHDPANPQYAVVFGKGSQADWAAKEAEKAGYKVYAVGDYAGKTASSRLVDELRHKGFAVAVAFVVADEPWKPGDLRSGDGYRDDIRGPNAPIPVLIPNVPQQGTLVPIGFGRYGVTDPHLSASPLANPKSGNFDMPSAAMRVPQASAADRRPLPYAEPAASSLHGTLDVPRSPPAERPPTQPPSIANTRTYALPPSSPSIANTKTYTLPPSSPSTRPSYSPPPSMLNPHPYTPPSAYTPPPPYTPPPYTPPSYTPPPYTPPRF